MNYGEYFGKIGARLFTPGVLLLIVGAVMVYTSSLVARRVAPEGEGRRYEVTNLAIKVAGCVIALIGALLVLEIIR